MDFDYLPIPNHHHYKVDQMDNRGNRAYASMPERLYVVKDKQVVLEVEIISMNLIMSKIDDDNHTLNFLE